ncbi:MAG: zinc ribbon domain-containing protein [Bacillota bacterium]|nr:zinc ribbon domain-containing protein [Bacillota bacterium]
MGLFDKMIKDGLNGALGEAVGKTLSEMTASKTGEQAGQGAVPGAAVPNAGAAAATVCPQCGQTVAGGQKFCPGCGAGLAQPAAAAPAGGEAASAKVCPKCGQTVGAEQKFCPGCGTGFSQPEAGGAAPSSQPAAAPGAGLNLEALGGLGGLFSTIQQAATGIVNEAAKSMKICPQCGQPAGADQKFCPGCGAELPQATLSEGFICPQCGKENKLTAKFCADCGAKLPNTISEEEAVKAKTAAVLENWPQELAVFPKWNGGGALSLEKEFDSDGSWWYMLSADGVTMQDLISYRQLLFQHGFAPGGDPQRPDIHNLYKTENGVRWHFSSEDGFGGGDNQLCVYYRIA